jgi:alpha-tubulin suppressor-like RCC1 family protein
MNDTIPRFDPTLIPDFANIIEISAGYFHSIILSSNGFVYAFGKNQVYSPFV